MGGFDRFLIRRVATAGAIAAVLALVPIIACSRASGPRGASSARSDVAAPSASAPRSPTSAAQPVAGTDPSSGAGASASLSGDNAAGDVPVIPSTRIDDPAAAQKVTAAAQKIGSDPAALLARVSRVRYEIYPGVFRGAAATLADGAGNDYDRAVLLHDFLAAASPAVKARYAFCTLSSQQSAAAIAAARAAYVAPAIGATADALAVKATPQLHDGFVRLAAFWRSAAAQERDQMAQLSADFQKAGARSTASAPAAALEAIAADHVWVQLEDRDKWTDLDPLAPTAAPGASMCAAASTSDVLPDAAFDTVTAVLRLESRDGNEQHEATIASGAWRTADLADAPLLFAFAESSELHQAAPQPAGMLAYTPLLIAGAHAVTAAPIVVPAPQKGPGSGQAAASAASAAAAAFGANPPAPAPAPEKPAGPIPVALRFDVAVAAPHVLRASVERPIFDRISAADRAAGRAASATLTASSLYPFGTVWNVAINLGTGVAGAGDGGIRDANSEEPATLIGALGVMHRSYYALRRAIFADALAPSAPPVVSIRPGISFLGLAPQAAGLVPFGLAIDRAREGALPSGGDAGSALAWGIASVYGERLAIGTQAMMTAGRNLDQLPFDDAIEMFYIARHSNNAPMIVRSTADVDKLPVSADAKARLTASIGGGASAVVTSAPVSYGGANDYGWWILDSRGTVTDEMQSGMHQAIPGYAKVVEEDTKEAIHFRRQGFIVRCAGLAAGAMMALAAARGGEGAQEIAQQAAEQISAMREANEAEEMREAALRCAK